MCYDAYINCIYGDVPPSVASYRWLALSQVTAAGWLLLRAQDEE